MLELSLHLRAEQETRRLATVVRDSNDAVILADTTGKILVWNRGAEDMYGSREAEALQMLQHAHETVERRVADRTAELTRAVQQLWVQSDQLRSLASELTLAQQRERRRPARRPSPNESCAYTLKTLAPCPGWGDIVAPKKSGGAHAKTHTLGRR